MDFNQQEEREYETPARNCSVVERLPFAFECAKTS
jgi:hypothetical protein